MTLPWSPMVAQGPFTPLPLPRELGIRKIVVPRAPGVFSAFGMLYSDLRYDYVRTWFTALETAPFDEVERIYTEMETDGRTAIDEASVSSEQVVVKRGADMRYVGQEHAVTVDLPIEVFESQDRAAIKTCFDDMHELRYGTAARGEKAEIVSLRIDCHRDHAQAPAGDHASRNADAAGRSANGKTGWYISPRPTGLWKHPPIHETLYWWETVLSAPHCWKNTRRPPS